MAKKKAAEKKRETEQADELNFERALQEVEQIVSLLEGGQLGLSESLKQYEQGIKQLKRCHELLDSAEQRVNVLAGFDSEGNPILEPMIDPPKNSKTKAAAKSSSPDLDIGNGKKPSGTIKRQSGGEGGNEPANLDPGLF